MQEQCLNCGLPVVNSISGGVGGGRSVDKSKVGVEGNIFVEG